MSIVIDLIRDLRYGARALKKAPVFAVSAILTLALGIGANATVFTVVNTILLHPLPVRNPSRLAVMYDAQDRQTRRSASRLALSYANFQDYAANPRAFAAIAAYTQPLIITLQDGGKSRRLFAQLVTQTYFDTLGVRPALGRFFTPAEDREPGAAPVAVLSYNAWQSRFDGEPDTVGRRIDLNGIAFTIIGVAPKGFLGLNAVFGPDVILPATMSEQAFPMEFRGVIGDRSKPFFHGVARLKPGVAMAQAQASLDLSSAELEREYPNSNTGHAAILFPMTEELYSGFGGGAALSFASAVLLFVVLLVLLTACANVASLLLARAMGRRQEIAVRLAIGANRGRLVRQHLAESALLSLAGSLAGLGLGWAGCRFLWSYIPAEYAQNMVAPHSPFYEGAPDRAGRLFDRGPGHGGVIHPQHSACLYDRSRLRLESPGHLHDAPGPGWLWRGTRSRVLSLHP